MLKPNNAISLTKHRHHAPRAILSAALRGFLSLPTWELLLGFYILFSLLRIALAYATTQSPVIMPDSALYLHLSRSIFADGALLFRGQPIRYEYILYPVLLAPLHLLPESINIYRAIQILNALFMHLAIFPSYALALKLTKSRNRALLVAVFTAIMPDFLMAQHIMAESLAFPLMLLTCYFFLLDFDIKGKSYQAVSCGGLGFLLYTLKPGYIALPASYFALLLWDALRKREMDRIIRALTGGLSLLLFWGLYTLLLRYGLHLSPSQSALYESQTHPLTWDHLMQTLNGLIMYGAFIPMAFAFFPLFLPAARLRSFEGKDRRLLQVVLVSLFAIVLGTVYIIYYDELTGSPYEARIHVRYVAAFLPVLLSFCLSPALDGKGMNTPLFAFASFSLFCLIRWDGSALLSGGNYSVDALLLTAATSSTSALNGRLLWPMACGIFLLVMSYRLIRHGFGAFEKRLLCTFLASAFLLNGVISYAFTQHHNDPVWPRDAREAVIAAGTEDTLGVVRDGAFFWTEAAELDVASRCELPVVELNDLILRTKDDGSLTSFLPASHWQENAVNRIGAPVRLILTNEMLDSLILASDVAAGAYSTQNGCYAILSVAPSKPWVHSALSGFDQKWVKEGSRFTLFDEGLRANGTVTLQLQARAGAGQAQLVLHCGTQEQSFLMEDQLSWISATFAVEDPGAPFTVTLSNPDGNIYVETYLVQ